MQDVDGYNIETILLYDLLNQLIEHCFIVDIHNIEIPVIYDWPGNTMEK